MRALIALASLLALLYPVAAEASIYDFKYAVHYVGLPDYPFYFSLDSSQGELNASGYTEFFNVTTREADGTPGETISELDVTSGSVTAIIYESSGVNDVFNLFFGESDGGYISSGDGPNIVFALGDHSGATAEGRAIFPASLDISAGGAPAAPEPHIWFLMAAGVGLVGLTLRRRRALIAPV